MLNPPVDMRRRAPSHLLVCCLIPTLAGSFFGCSSEVPPGEPIRFEAGRDFKPFELLDLEGQNRKLSEFLAQSTLVSFFFPTCGACNQEMPYFQQFYERYRDKGFSVVAVNVIPEQDELVRRWKENNGFTFPVLVGAHTDSLIEDYQLSSTPLNFLLDSEGKILSRQEGYAPGSEARIEAGIRQALGLN